jgi:hypothetical protein
MYCRSDPQQQCEPGWEPSRLVPWDGLLGVNYPKFAGTAWASPPNICGETEPLALQLGDNQADALAESSSGLYKAVFMHQEGPWRNVEGAKGTDLGICAGGVTP